MLSPGMWLKIITKGWVIYNQRSRKEWPDNWHRCIAFTSFLFRDRLVWQVVKLCILTCTQIEIHKVHKVQKGVEGGGLCQVHKLMSQLLNTYCTFYSIIKASLDFSHRFLSHKCVMTLKNKPQQHTQFLQNLLIKYSFRQILSLFSGSFIKVSTSVYKSVCLKCRL